MQKEFKMCSLFSGIGGLELGLEEAVPGLRTCWQVEQNEFCRRVLAKHWPDAERFEDVRTIRAEDIRGADALCGGFPCQDISTLNQAGAGLAGERSGLWWEMHRLISLALPRVVVAENVPALTSRGLSEVLCALAGCGYSCEWDTISAASVGARHRRDRVFIIGRRDAANAKGIKGNDGESTQGKSQREGQRKTRGEICGNASDSSRSRLEKRQRAEREWAFPAIARSHGWSIESGICPVVDGLPRGLAGRRREQIKALGNAVVPQVAYQVGLRVNQILKETEQ